MALISLLHAVKAVHKVVEGPRPELDARAKHIAHGYPTIEAIHSAVAAQMVVATVAATSEGKFLR